MRRGKVSVAVVLLEANLQVIPILLIHSERSSSENFGKICCSQKNIQNVAAFSNREAFCYQCEDIFDNIALDMEISPHKDRNTQLSVSQDEEQRHLRCTQPGDEATPPQPSPDRGARVLFRCSKTTQRNKQVAMGRKKFNMDPKKVLWVVVNLGELG